MSEHYLLEKARIKQLTAPVDGNTGPLTGARISMKDCQRVAIIVELGAGTGSTVTLSLKQHNAAAAGTSKALSTLNPYWVKSGVETTQTKVEPVAATDTYDLSTRYAADGGVVVFEVLQEDLDVNNGFTHVSLDLADMGTAKLVSVLAITLGDESAPSYSQSI